MVIGLRSDRSTPKAAVSSRWLLWDKRELSRAGCGHFLALRFTRGARAGAWALCSPRGRCAYAEPGVGRTAWRFCI